MIPESVKSKQDKFAVELHNEWQSFCEEINAIRCAEEEKGIRIEKACRLLWDLWESEDKREAMGWAAWEDLFHPGNEELATFFDLISDRIILNSTSNQMRFHNLLLIDSDPTGSELHILRRPHWTPITQFGSRISRLKETLPEPDGEDKRKKMEEIITPDPMEKPDPEPVDDEFEMKRLVGYWRGKKALQLADTDSPLVVKLRSRLTLLKTFFVLKKGDAKILAMNDDKTMEAATVLLPPMDPDYQAFVEWLNSRLGLKVVG
jgi:hypothetical protein